MSYILRHIMMGSLNCINTLNDQTAEQLYPSLSCMNAIKRLKA